MSALVVTASTRTRSLTPWLIATLAAGGCGAVAWWGVERSPKIGLVIAMAALGLAPVIVRAVQGCWDPFEPINLVVLAVLFWFVARPLMELHEHLASYAPVYDASLGFYPAMIVGLAGTAVLYAAYFSRAGNRLARRMPVVPADWDSQRSVRYTMGLLAVGTVLEMFFFAQVGLHQFLHIYSGRGAHGDVSALRSSSGYFDLGLYVAVPGSLIALTAWRRRRSFQAGGLAALCIALSLALTVPRGDRTLLLALVFPLIVLPYIQRRLRPRVVSVLATVLVAAIAFNVNAALRRVDRSKVGVQHTIASAITHPQRELLSFLRGSDGSEFSVLEIEMHQYQIGALPHWPGSTLLSLATGWIPHQFLKSKPPSPDQHLNDVLFPTGAFGPPVYGAFYADDGWLSLILLSAAVGVALRALWEYFRANSESLGVQLFFAATLPLVAVLLRADLSLMLAGAVFFSLPIVLCVVRCSRAPLNLRLGVRQRSSARA